MYKVIPLVIIFALLFSACAADTPHTDSNARLEVVTSFYPVWLIAKEVVADTEDVKLVNMAPAQTGCLHDYTLTMTDRKTLEHADLFLCCGAGMESFLDEVTDAHPNLTVCETADGAELLPSVTGETDYNPHVWMSAEGVCTMAGNIAAALSASDPAYVESYRKNAEAFCEKVRAQYDEFAGKLADAEGISVVSFHESFDYVARDFGLDVAAVIAKEPDEEPSAKEIEGCINAVKENGVTALFSDSQYSDRAAETVANETGAAIFPMDSIVSGGETDTYISLMRKNYETLVSALIEK